MTTTTAAFDIAALTAALEGRDAAGQLACYLPDAKIVVVDHDNPPSRPRTITGTDAIGEYLTDVCDRDMTHQVRAALATSDRIAFELVCSYPDGTRVTCMCIAGIDGGRIAWHHQVQAWDS
jgi:hypothetical protein